MPIIQQVSGAVSTGRKLYRKKGFTDRTKSAFDFKNTYCQPKGAAALPNAMVLKNLAYGNPADGAISGANVGTVGGGIPIDANKSVLLGDNFRIELGITEVLFIVWIEQMTQVFGAGSAAIVGLMNNTSADFNWGFYMNAGSPNINSRMGGLGAPVIPSLSNGVHQLALWAKVNGANLERETYLDGELVGVSTPSAFSAWPQPAFLPAFGRQPSGTPAINAQWLGEAFAATRFDMATETATRAELVKSDYDAYAARFAA